MKVLRCTEEEVRQAEIEAVTEWVLFALSDLCALQRRAAQAVNPVGSFSGASRLAQGKCAI